MGLTMLDLNSAARNQSLVFSPQPPSPLPRMWIGFVLAVVFLAAEILELWQGNDSAVGPWTFAASILGWGYWLFCVHRLHKILGQLSPHVGDTPTYPITPKQGAFYHLIPVYGLFWFFKWPGQLAEFLNEHFTVKIASPRLWGLLLLMSSLLMRLDGFIGLTALFAVTSYFSRKLRRAIAEREAVRGSVGTFA